MKNNGLIKQHLKYKFLYSTMGLVLGLISILCGSYLFINGIIIGSTQFSALIFGNKAQLTDAAPGTILFVIGLFLVITTRYGKIKLPTSEGGDFVGNQIFPIDIHNFPERSREKIVKLIKHLLQLQRSINSNELEFLIEYLKLQGPGVDMVSYYNTYHYHIEKGEDNDLWDIYSRSKSFEEFILLSFKRCYEYDKETNILQICSLIRVCSNTDRSIKLLDNINDIVYILQKGIWDTSKINELRVVFLWFINCLDAQFSRRFYMEEFADFLDKNAFNEEICASFIGSIDRLNESSIKEEAIKTAVHYLDKHPEVKNLLHSNVKRRLGIT